ncbi:MAG: xanthine phosphoribosyltransferase [Anaerolineae bacterium]|nr:xanthine phosphoribosyltransferase [Anaerolineae bacterium]
MEILKKRILAEGRNLGNGILKIDSILNHQVDPALMVAIGQEIARRFAGAGVTRILTAEVSGIAPALTAGYALNVPVVWARKNRPVTMKQPVYVESAPSHTKGGEVKLMVSPEFIHAADRILIVDDFLASGKTLHALGRLVHNAGAGLVGIACVVEKTFEGGREFLADLDVRIESLVCIAGLDGGGIQFAE